MIRRSKRIDELEKEIKRLDSNVSQLSKSLQDQKKLTIKLSRLLPIPTQKFNVGDNVYWEKSFCEIFFYKVNYYGKVYAARFEQETFTWVYDVEYSSGGKETEKVYEDKLKLHIEGES